MKWYTYVICFVLIIVGVFSGMQFYRELKAESYVNGSIDITNRFSEETFNYSSTSLVFYHDLYDDTNTYTFEKALTNSKTLYPLPVPKLYVTSPGFSDNFSNALTWP